MRLLRFLVVLLACGAGPVVALTGASAAAVHRRPDGRTVVIVPKWHEVAGGLGLSPQDDAVAAASDQYLALLTARQSIVPMDTSTDRLTPVSPPDCPGLGQSGFGGPWFAVGCSDPYALAPDAPARVDLLDLATGQWTVLQLDTAICGQPAAGCAFASVGSTWITFTTPPFDYHDPAPTYLQNITTGAVENDPAFGSRAGAQDSLNDASGVGHPCVKLPYPARDQDFLGLVGGDELSSTYTRLGRFVLTTGISGETNDTPSVLQECGAKTQITIPPLYVVGTPDMVLWSEGAASGGDIGPLNGVSLPGLRPLVVRDVKQLAAVSDQTIYEARYDNASASLDLLAANVPKLSPAPQRRPK